MSAPIDRAGWGPGPWDAELDSALWLDPATGLTCTAHRARTSGTWSGYVQLPDEHPWCAADANDLVPQVRVHGGVTFVGVPLGQPIGGTWVGFDCAHFGDVMPALQARTQMGFAGMAAGPVEQYRDIAFVREQCAQLAAQIVAASVDGAA